MRSLPRIAATTFAFTAGLLAWPSEPAVAQGPYQYHAVTPCRVLDTRQNPGPTGQNNGNALPNPGPHHFRIQGFCGVPDGARAVTVNATAITPNREGFLSLYPVGGSPPVVSMLNFLANEPALANGAIVPLGTVSGPGDDDLAMQNGMPIGPGGLLHVALDVTGYFE